MSESEPEIPDQSEQLDIDDESQSLVDRTGGDPLDEGYSPPERWSAAERFGNTAYEEAVGETLDQRLAQEEPDDGDVDADRDYDDFLDDGEVGDVRAGRLAAGSGDVLAEDVGIDGGAASAEEAAVHVIDED